MSTIQSILKEEYDRLQRLLERYERDLAELPSGSISIKQRNNRKYAYRAYRENDKVRTDYIGPVDSENVRELQKLIDKRKELEKLIRTSRERIVEIRKAIKK